MHVKGIGSGQSTWKLEPCLGAIAHGAVWGTGSAPADINPSGAGVASRGPCAGQNLDPLVTLSGGWRFFIEDGPSRSRSQRFGEPPAHVDTPRRPTLVQTRRRAYDHYTA
jgi:hypothetical protein